MEQLKRGHQQLKMRFKYNASARLVSKIKGYNSMLVSLAERVRNNMQTPDPKSLPPHKHPAFRAVRVSANRAYTALQAFHQCVCQSLHSVFLRLESRLENGSLNKEEAAEENNPRFCVLLTFEHKYPIVKNPPSTWVTFSISPPQESGNHSNAPGLGAAGSTRPAKPTAAGASCTSLSRAQLSDMKTDCIFQSLLDNRYDKFTGYLPGHHVHSLKTHPTGHKPRVVIISLRDIISRDIQKFTRRDKVHLAVILASSILQLEQTPWLRDVWGKDDIMFTECPEGPHYNYPFVKGVAGTETPTRGEEEDSIQRGRDRVLSALGLLLIEVCLGQPLQNLAPEYESSSDTIIGLGPNKGTILQLLQKVSEEGGDLYYRAVESCLYFDACTRGTGTVGDSFEANFYENVVKVLQKDLSRFTLSNEVKKCSCNME